MWCELGRAMRTAWAVWGLGEATCRRVPGFDYGATVVLIERQPGGMMTFFWMHVLSLN